MVVGLALTGASFAQLPATMTEFGVNLPSMTIRLPGDICEQLVEALAAPAVSYECYETYAPTTEVQRLTFELQTTSFRAARYQLVHETQLTDIMLGQFWINELHAPDQMLNALYFFQEPTMTLVFLTMPDD